MDSSENVAGPAEPEQPGVERREPGRLERTLEICRAAGKKLGVLATTRPYVAIGIAAGAGMAAGALVASRLARTMGLIATGYAIHNLRGSGEPLFKAGIDRLAKALAG